MEPGGATQRLVMGHTTKGCTMRRLLLVGLILAGSIPASLGMTSSSASACAGLIGSNGAVNLGQTTTLAAYHDGVEHYVTAFRFLGGGGQFGTLIPLPGVPTNVERGGAWTLQRLDLETRPPQVAFAAARDSASGGKGAEVLIPAP